MIVRVLCFLAGILSVQQLPVLPSLDWWPVALFSLVLLLKLHYWRWLFFITGILWAIGFATIRLSDRLPEHLAGQDLQIQGYVADLPERESNHIRFNFKVFKSTQKIPDKIRLTWYYPEQTIKAGQYWALTVRLKPPHGNFNPGSFDYERWLFTEDIGATGYIRSKPEPLLLDIGAVKFSLLVWRQYIVEQLEQLLANSPNLAMIKALTIGDGDSLSLQQWEVFRKTGTTHLMVISGSHIGLIASLAYLLIIKIWARTGIMAWSPQKVAAITALFAAVLYAGLTGFAIPAQRSALMIAIATLAIVSQRNTSPYNILAVALFTALMFDPLVVLSAGFWLSFVAVSLIIYVIAGRLKKPGFILGSLKINWITSIGLAPLLLYFFQQISLISPIANLIAAPIIGLYIVPLALLSTLIMLVVPEVAAQLFTCIDVVLQCLWWGLVKLAELPLATISHNQPEWWTLMFVIPGILLLFAPKGIPCRWLGFIMLLPMLFTANNKIATGEVKLTLLDVGQGLSAVVQTASHTLIYDAGAKFSSTSDSGQSVIVPFLRSQSIDKVDTLIISHGDNDHIGGVDSLMTNYPADKLLTSVPTMLRRYSPTPCKAGQTWLWDEVIFSILSPADNEFSSDNDSSCVLQVKTSKNSLLLPGDIEAGAESRLVVTYQNNLNADVLIAPHHGSQSSSTSSFLTAVNPDIILIPAGYRNQFGHPHKDVIDRYQGMGIEWLNNADAGAIKVTLGKQLKAEAWRSVDGKYWNYVSKSHNAQIQSKAE